MCACEPMLGHVSIRSVGVYLVNLPPVAFFLLITFSLLESFSVGRLASSRAFLLIRPISVTCILDLHLLYGLLHRKTRTLTLVEKYLKNCLVESLLSLKRAARKLLVRDIGRNAILNVVGLHATSVYLFCTSKANQLPRCCANTMDTVHGTYPCSLVLVRGRDLSTGLLTIVF